MEDPQPAELTSHPREVDRLHQDSSPQEELESVPEDFEPMPQTVPDSVPYEQQEELEPVPEDLEAVPEDLEAVPEDLEAKPLWLECYTFRGSGPYEQQSASTMKKH